MEFQTEWFSSMKNVVCLTGRKPAETAADARGNPLPKSRGHL